MNTHKPIYVTQPELPPLDEFIPYLKEIWESRILTNGGQFHCLLEIALRQYLDIADIALFANGTLALITALQSLRIAGEVITTPFSFVATSHSLLWNGLTPIFVDIEPDSLNLDPKKIESAITPRTTAIMPVHCYGRPCNIAAIQKIADHYNLKVIYDAAHAFGVRDAGGSILRHGDLSVLSFHATKVFNTFEGGAIICPDTETKQRIDQLKNFGFTKNDQVVTPGINGKMSEFNAALGLAQLQHIEATIKRRRIIDERYRALLADVKGICCLKPIEMTTQNYSYFPILVEQDYSLCRDDLFTKMEQQGIYTRRYFFPLISEMSMYRELPSAHPDNLPVATETARNILCLPIYPSLTEEQQRRIVAIIALQ